MCFSIIIFVISYFGICSFVSLGMLSSSTLYFRTQHLYKWRADFFCWFGSVLLAHSSIFSCFVKKFILYLFLPIYLWDYPFNIYRDIHDGVYDYDDIIYQWQADTGIDVTPFLLPVNIRINLF